MQEINHHNVFTFIVDLIKIIGEALVRWFQAATDIYKFVKQSRQSYRQKYFNS